MRVDIVSRQQHSMFSFIRKGLRATRHASRRFAVWFGAEADSSSERHGAVSKLPTDGSAELSTADIEIPPVFCAHSEGMPDNKSAARALQSSTDRSVWWDASEDGPSHSQRFGHRSAWSGSLWGVGAVLAMSFQGAHHHEAKREQT